MIWERFKHTSFIEACVIIISAQVIKSQALNVTVNAIFGEWKEVFNVTALKGRVFHSTSNTSSLLELNCWATVPIDWTVTGFISHPEILKIFPPRRDFPKNVFSSRLLITLASTMEFPGRGFSIQTDCRQVDGLGQIENVFLFGQDMNISPFAAPSHQKVIDSTLIPCPTMNPITTAAPTLYRKNIHGGYEEVLNDSVMYHPVQGFLSNMVFNGLYLCKQDSYNVTVDATISGEYILNPKTKTTSAFYDEVIHLECLSRSKLPVEIIVDSAAKEAGNITIAKEHLDNGEMVNISTKYQRPQTITGTALCVATNRSLVTTKTLMMQDWAFTFVPRPEIQFVPDGGFNRVVCVPETGAPDMLQVVQCNNPADCGVKRRCFQNVESCDVENETSNKTVDCTGSKKRRCIKVSSFFYTGVVQCTMNGLTQETEFFTSLIGKIYSDYRDADKSELLQISSEIVNNVTGVHRYVCTAIKFLFFACNLAFEIEYRNGTKIFLDDSQVVNISNTQANDQAITQVIEMQISPEAVVMYCHAPWGNSTETLVTWTQIVASSDDSPKSSQNGTLVYIVVASGIIIAMFVFMIVCIIHFMRKYQKSQILLRSLTDNELEEFFQGRPEMLTNAVGREMDVVDFLPYNTDFEIPLDDLEFEDSILGKGHFSYVVRGKVLSKTLPVAIKVSLPSEDITLFKTHLTEVKIMIYIGRHENIVALVGVCTEGIRNRTIYIATEICEFGSLNIFLRNARPDFINLMNANHELDMSLLSLAMTIDSTRSVITTLDLISFAEQIAKGMEYVSSKSITHGDLAARNVLLTKNKIAKISDFGLSKRLYENREYVKKSKTPLPWRWMAIESLNTLTFSTASDVWAYGVILYEIFTLGDVPFPMEEWNSDFQAKFEGGMRMGRPKYGMTEIYTKMGQCWEDDPASRPTFLTLRVFFEDMANKYASSQSRCISNTNLISPEHTDAMTNILDDRETVEYASSYLDLVEMK